MQKGESHLHALNLHAYILSRIAGMENVCRYLKESSKVPESEWEYNIEMVCELRAFGDKNVAQTAGPSGRAV